VIPEKHIIVQPVKKFPFFMEHEDLLPFSQELVTGIYSEADESRSHTHALFI
jgi:hypothetical protein